MKEFKLEWDKYVEENPESISFEEWAHAFESWEEDDLEDPELWVSYIKLWEAYLEKGGTSARAEGWEGF